MKISIVTGTFNEQDNIGEFYERCVAVMRTHPKYEYEFIVADNRSTDLTQLRLAEIAGRDPNFKVIFNANNFGFVRSQFNALLQATGDAVVFMFSDLQDPPEVINEFIEKWESGYQVVCGVKDQTTPEGFLMTRIRRCYYKFLKRISDVELINNFYGFGLYDKSVVRAMSQYGAAYPYLRGLIAEVGFRRCLVAYTQAKRSRGKSSFNFWRMYDVAMTGVVNYSKVPLRAAVFSGCALAVVSFGIAFITFILKLLDRNYFSVGIAAIIIGLFFFSGVILVFLGIIGEYIIAIFRQVRSDPLVVEERRLNF